MAPRKAAASAATATHTADTAATETAPTDTVAAHATEARADDFSFAEVEVSAVKELPKGTRDTAPNPLETHVKNALDQGPKVIPVPNGDRAMEAQRLIRRAVTTNNYSMRIRFTDANDQAITPAKAEASTDPVRVYFTISSEKSERAYTPRKYTNADIRKWANLGDGDKVTKEIRNAYRVEHGYDVRKR